MQGKVIFNLIFALVTSSLLFPIYQIYLRPLKYSFVFYLDMSLIAFILIYQAILLIKHGHSATRNHCFALFAIILSYELLKLGYLLAMPFKVISLYPDAYNVYTVARSLSTGHLFNSEKYPLSAKSLSLTPSVPLFLYIFSSITNFRLESVVKYYPLMSALIILVSYFITLRKIKIIDNKNLAYLGIVIGVFNPWLLGFITWGHYANFSTIFMNTLLWLMLSLMEQNKNQFELLIMYFVISLILVFTHTYMSIIFLIMIFIYIMIRLIILKRIFSIQYLLLATGIVVILLHTLYFAYQTMNTLVDYVHYIIDTVIAGSPTIAVKFYGTPQASHLPVVLVKYIGAISFVVLTFVSLTWYVLEFRSELEKYLSFLSMLLTGLLVHMPYYLAPRYATDLFNRTIYFTSIAGSPFIVTFLSKILEKNSRKVKLFIQHTTQYVMTIVLFFIVMFYLLHAVNPDVVDWTTPIISGEDSRLPRMEWFYLSSYISSKAMQCSEVYGLRIGLHYIGYLSWKDYKQLSISPSTPSPLIPPENFIEIIDRLKGDLVFLRSSMVQYPDPGYSINYETFIYVISQSNLVYSASDAIVILP